VYLVVNKLVTQRRVFIGFVRFLTVNKGIVLDTINQLMFAIVNCCVLFEVRTEFLNIIYTSYKEVEEPGQLRQYSV
jgi:hypothetical protein